MKIIVDAFGGDKAPLEVLKGCAMAIEEYGVQIVLTGDEQTIRNTALENAVSLHNMEIVHAADVITMHDEPTSVIHERSDSSMAVALKLLADGGGDAVVSAGNTGALMVGATMIVKRIKGIKRPALAPIIPSDTGAYMLLDAGANLECRPEMLVQFGLMGSVYMNKIMGVDKPRVGLVNVGEEETKGTDLQKQTYALLKEAPVNFSGNIEARDIPAGQCDVVVADGFTGNIILKLTEGVGLSMYGNIKSIFKQNFISKLSAVLVIKGLKQFKKKMDYTEYGGAPLMGTAKPVIKAHGSSNAVAFKNAIRQARDFVAKDVISEIEQSLAQH